MFAKNVVSNKKEASKQQASGAAGERFSTGPCDLSVLPDGATQEALPRGPEMKKRRVTAAMRLRGQQLQRKGDTGTGTSSGQVVGKCKR